MAVSARTPQLKTTFLALSKNWEKLALQLENALAQIAESEGIRFNVREASKSLASVGKNSSIQLHDLH